MNELSDSWNAFSPDIASKYLKTYGSPSKTSKQLLLDILRQYTAQLNRPKLIDLGCGNGQLCEFFDEKGYLCDYTGVDFSDVLLDAGRNSSPHAMFIKDDVNSLAGVSGKFDVALYSHVVELLTSPEASLARARNLADLVVIRFYEPPEFDMDSVELRWLDIGSEKQVPYLRRKMSRDYYRLILARLDCKRVDIFRDSSKDQIHVLVF